MRPTGSGRSVRNDSGGIEDVTATSSAGARRRDVTDWRSRAHAPYRRRVSSFRSFTPDGIDALLPVSLRLHREWRSALETLSYGGALPPLPLAMRAALRDEWDLDIVHETDGIDPLTSPAFGILYARVRSEQVLRAVSARTNLTLAGTTVAVVGDGRVSEALTTSLRVLGASVVRVTDSAVVALAARLDGLRAIGLNEAADREVPVHLTLLTGEGHGILPISTLAGIVADASPGSTLTAGLSTSPSPRPFVRRAGEAFVVEMPSPLPEPDAVPCAPQRRLLDALISLLVLTAQGADDARFAREVTP